MGLPIGDELLGIREQTLQRRFDAGSSCLKVTPSARPSVAESSAIFGHSCSGIPSMIAITRCIRFGEITDEVALTAGAKPSINSLASATNLGESAARSLGENAG